MTNSDLSDKIIRGEFNTDIGWYDYFLVYKTRKQYAKRITWMRPGVSFETLLVKRQWNQSTVAQFEDYTGKVNGVIVSANNPDVIGQQFDVEVQ